jgi:hypothetical protein
MEKNTKIFANLGKRAYLCSGLLYAGAYINKRKPTIGRMPTNNYDT